MDLTVNGERRSVGDDITLEELVGGDARGVAVAVNEEVVPRSTWRSTALREGDRIEILEARQGG